MKRWMASLLALALICCAAGAKAVTREELPGLSAYAGWELVDWCAVGDSGWGFASLKRGEQNALAAFERENGAWAMRFVNPRALPQGPMRILLQDVSGEFKIALQGDDFLFDSARWGSALMTFWSNGEYYENLCVFEQDAQGRWLLSHYAHAGQSGMMEIHPNELVYYEAFDHPIRVKATVQRDLERFDLNNLPRTAQQAAQPQALPPDIPEGWLTAREVPLEGQGLLPVYAAPGKGSLRAAGGKAAVSPKGWAQVFGLENGFALIQYALGPGRYRVGYVEARCRLPAWYLKEELGFTRVSALVVAAAEATDDPLGAGEALGSLQPGQAVSLLSLMGELAYFEAVQGGKTYRAFAPLGAFDREPALPRPSREMEMPVQGVWKRVMMTRLLFSSPPSEIWYDAERFEAVADGDSVTLAVKGAAPGVACLRVRATGSGDPRGSLDALQTAYEAAGWACEPLAYQGQLASLAMKEAPQAFLARREGIIRRCYAASTQARDYLLEVEIRQSAEGTWGAQLDFMMGTLKEAPAQPAP